MTERILNLYFCSYLYFIFAIDIVSQLHFRKLMLINQKKANTNSFEEEKLIFFILEI